ncbi:MAG: 30S ribosomal protein S13 [Planctomycetes bacterium]|nr:30S ribosomal protein S13 [Planctomycetota bacterium]MBU1517330.1 30S ribosomal protein S13 [Planctomycetota bacterium]MBU2458434.1 30S ribosomal protein S13 [Planctomycetota bacterium]MBU2596935.1 30S ribosomal protein S13 [Planctomycetota bacterium]
MPRIVGVDIPNDKAIAISLTYIHGIGKYIAEKILDEIGIKFDVRANKLTEDEISKIAQIIDRDYRVEGQLRRQVSQDIARLKDIGCYRGLRHRKGLPVRGQQTQSNARTRKGKRKTVAGKKGVKEIRS